MAYDEELAHRVRATLGTRVPYDERAMFGGLAFMVNTHMACGILGDDLMVRVGRDAHDDALARGAREMTFTGRPMRGMVMVPGGMLDSALLETWVGQATAYALEQAPKPAKRPQRTQQTGPTGPTGPTEPTGPTGRTRP